MNQDDLNELVASGDQLPDEYKDEDVLGEDFVGRAITSDGDKVVVVDEE